MKYKLSHYLEIDRSIFKSDVSYHAKWLYCVLSELEHSFTNPKGTTIEEKRGKTQWFFRKQEDLLKDSGLHREIYYKARKELIDNGFIKLGWMHFEDTETKKLSTKRIRTFTLL